MATDRIIAPWTPDNYDVDGGGGRSLGFDFVCDVDTEILGVWWFQETGSADGPTTVTGRVYLQSDQSLIATANNGSLTQGWNLITFAAPFTAAADVIYTAAVWEAINTRAGYTNGMLTDDVVDASGHVRALASGARYGLSQGAPAYPGTGSGTFLHGVDIEFTVPGGGYVPRGEFLAFL